MLLCGSDLLESFSKPGVWIPDQSKEEVEPEEVLGRITAACARLVQGTRQALAPCHGGRVRGGVGSSAGRARRCGCRGRLSPGHWRSRRTDATLRAATIGDGDRARR
uniref:Uncharacterized protein n=1 Tax=Triticum urartu TaxID=4572 RepID=A0A8R7R6A2_TRIUA